MSVGNPGKRVRAEEKRSPASDGGREEVEGTAGGAETGRRARRRPDAQRGAGLGGGVATSRPGGKTFCQTPGWVGSRGLLAKHDWPTPKHGPAAPRRLTIRQKLADRRRRRSGARSAALPPGNGARATFHVGRCRHDGGGPRPSVTCKARAARPALVAAAPGPPPSVGSAAAPPSEHVCKCVASGVGGLEGALRQAEAFAGQRSLAVVFPARGCFAEAERPVAGREASRLTRKWLTSF